MSEQSIVRHTFDVVPLTQGYVLPGRVDFSVDYEVEKDRMIARLRYYLLGGTHVVNVPAVYAPANWWEHLKADLRWRWPRLFWRLNHRRVRLRSEQKIHERVCPHHDVERAGPAKCIEFLTQSATEWR